jgi:hypothetical protein
MAAGAVAAACSTTPYRGIPDQAEIPRLGASPIVVAAETPTSTSTTTPPVATVASVTTAAPPASTPVTTTTVLRPGGRLQGVGTTGVVIALPDAFADEPGADVRTLLPGIADGLEQGGLLKRPVLVAVRRDTGAVVAPSVTAFELPASGATAAGVLAALRTAVGDRAAAGVPAAEPSRIGEAGPWK